MSGPQLVVVGTPIGNLGDWSARAQDVLRSVGLIACEDTRRTGLLLNRHGLANPGMVVMNEHTEHTAAEKVLTALRDGRSVAVLSDAGMPAISDPGALVVDAVAAAGFTVTVVPGPTASTAALALSGFGGAPHVFEGFLPRKGLDRKRRLAALADEERNVVLYEAPHRIERTLQDLALHMEPSRRCIVARELTKLHETVWRGSLADAAAGIGEPRGEYVVVVERREKAIVEFSDADVVGLLAEQTDNGLSTRDAVRHVVELTGLPKRRVYGLATGPESPSGPTP